MCVCRCGLGMPGETKPGVQGARFKVCSPPSGVVVVVSKSIPTVRRGNLLGPADERRELDPLGGHFEPGMLCRERQDREEGRGGRIGREEGRGGETGGRACAWSVCSLMDPHAAGARIAVEPDHLPPSSPSLSASLLSTYLQELFRGCARVDVDSEASPEKVLQELGLLVWVLQLRRAVGRDQEERLYDAKEQRDEGTPVSTARGSRRHALSRRTDGP